MLIVYSERNHPKGHHRGKRYDDTAERLGNAEPNSLSLAQRLGNDGQLGNIYKRLTKEHDEGEEQSRLKSIPKVQFDATPKVVRDKNPFGPNHIADNVHSARKPYRRDERSDGDGSVHNRIRLHEQHFRKAHYARLRRIADSEICPERISNAVTLIHNKAKDKNCNDGNEENQNK